MVVAGEERAIDPLSEAASDASESDDDSDDSSSSSQWTSSESETEEITQEYLQSLIETAKKNARERAKLGRTLVERWEEQDVIRVESDEAEYVPRPPLAGGNAHRPAIGLCRRWTLASFLLHTLNLERAAMSRRRRYATLPCPVRKQRAQRHRFLRLLQSPDHRD